MGKKTCRIPDSNPRPLVWQSCSHPLGHAAVINPVLLTLVLLLMQCTKEVRDIHTLQNSFKRDYASIITTTYNIIGYPAIYNEQ